MSDTGSGGPDKGPSMYVTMGAIAAGVIVVILLAALFTDEPDTPVVVADSAPVVEQEEPAMPADGETDTGNPAEGEPAGEALPVGEEVSEDMAAGDADAAMPADEADGTVEADMASEETAAQDVAGADAETEADPASADAETDADPADVPAVEPVGDAASDTTDVPATETPVATEGQTSDARQTDEGTTGAAVVAPERTGGVRVTVFGGDNPDEGTRIEDDAAPSDPAPADEADDQTGAAAAMDLDSALPALSEAMEGADAEVLLEIARQASQAASDAAEAANVAAEAARAALEMLEQQRATE